jgi:soluble lytic murein transglycosylase-like protein
VLAAFVAVLLCAAMAQRPAHASIQAWEDHDGIHLSNTEAPQAGADVLEEAGDARPGLVSLAPSSVDAAADAAPAGPDIRRLVAHDPRTAARLARYAPLVSSAARLHGVDAALLHAVVAIESAYNPQARSARGAIGLMQVMPATAARYGIRNLEDPGENLRAGCLYLRDLLQLFHENIDLAVAAYNAGENAVLRHGNRIPPYPETLRYVPQVVEIYHGLLH